MMSRMKSGWFGITGAGLVLTALVLGAVGPRLFPDAFMSASAMPSGMMTHSTMMHDTMMGGSTTGGMMHGTMSDGMMMGGMMSGQVGGDASLPFDQRFLDQMIMHHEGAIMSTQMMIASSARPELRDLAQRIITGQQRELDQMRQWRTAWYGSAAPSMTHDAMMAQMGGDAMMNGGGMGQMMGANADADHMYLQMMIPHHQAATAMAQQALAQAEHPEIKTLAEGVIATQQAEIEEMQGYLTEWYGGK